MSQRAFVRLKGTKQNTRPLGRGWESGELEQGLALWYGAAVYQLLGWTGLFSRS